MNSPDLLSTKSNSGSSVSNGFSPNLPSQSPDFNNQTTIQRSNSSLNSEFNRANQSAPQQGSSALNSEFNQHLSDSNSSLNESLAGPSTSSRNGFTHRISLNDSEIVLVDEIDDAEQTLKCCICRQIFPDNLSLQIHLKCHIGDKPHKCSYCSKSFSHDSHLQMHVKIHLGIKPYHCEFCDKAFIQKGNLQSHLRTHNGQRPFRCDICNKCFTQRGNLQTHIKLHFGDKPFACPLCGKRFNQNGNLQSHIRSHDDQKPFKCEICLKTYSQKSNLEVHMWSHNGVKPFTCHVCDKSFSQKTTLKAHIKLHGETGEDKKVSSFLGLSQVPQFPPLPLPMLGGTAFPGQLNIPASGGGLRLSSMGESSSSGGHKSPEQSNPGIGANNFKCLTCSKTFDSETTLKNHCRSCSKNKSYDCVICSLTFPDNFSLQSHLVMHSVAVEQVYRCQICGITFDNSDLIKQHISSHVLNL